MRLHLTRPVLRSDLSDVSVLADCVSQSKFRVARRDAANEMDAFQVVQEYERAVMFRLGRILGGAKVGVDHPLASLRSANDRLGSWSLHHRPMR